MESVFPFLSKYVCLHHTGTLKNLKDLNTGNNKVPGMN